MNTQIKVSEESFNGQSFYIGIDVHKLSWKVTILGQEYEHKTMSQNPDPMLLARYMNKNFPGGSYYAVYEAGFSGLEACRILNQLGVNCIVVHAPDIPTSHKEKMQKTDKADSRKLARSLRNQELNGIHIPDRQLEADRALVRQRFRLVKEIIRTKNRIKSLLFQFGIDTSSELPETQSRYWTKAFIDWLKIIPVEDSLRKTIDNYIRFGEFQKTELLKVNKQLRVLAKSDQYNKNYVLLKTIPGIGPLAALTFLVQVGDISRFSKLDELCNYIGLVPRMHSSGDTIRVGSIINRGRKELKSILIEASWQAIRGDPALMLKFNELLPKMNRNKAIIRIARKLLSRIRYVLINQVGYELGVIK